jgi:hypothetical protein
LKGYGTAFELRSLPEHQQTADDIPEGFAFLARQTIPKMFAELVSDPRQELVVRSAGRSPTWVRRKAGSRFDSVIVSCQ